MGNLFLKAQPIWVEGMEKTENIRVQFKGICPKVQQAEIRIATSGIYKLYINESFVSYGPARAGRGYFRQENIDISSFLTQEVNTIVIEVAGYYCNSYYVMRQPSFLQAEVTAEGGAVIFTGKDFSARINPYYIRKIQRYSYQRPFAESYTRINSGDTFFKDTLSGDEKIIVTENRKIINRGVPYPKFEGLNATLLSTGFAESTVPEEYSFDRYVLNVGMGENDLTGWELNQLECCPERDWQELRFTQNGVKNNSYRLYEFPHNATGNINFTVKAKEAVRLYVAFDEILTGGMVDPRRLRCCNIIRYDLSAGEHQISSFEIYTMKYLQIAVIGGDCEIDNVHLREYKHPPVEIPSFEDGKLKLIVQSAVETYRQNAVDLFTDCPSRERAGWLCDSFFLGRTEFALTGKNRIEEAFLENFLMEEAYGNLPVGMFPMCYPADHSDGNYIPNWAMWLAVELADYKKRSGKRELIERFREKLYKLLDFFRKYENSYGLLENLDAWVFVEWSRANHTDLVSKINFPSNMMYYAALKSVSELYGDTALAEKAADLKETINKYSYKNGFFADHGESTVSGIAVKNEYTEVCQYYAFFCGVAAKESHPELFNTLCRDFGPNRNTETVYPEVHKAAPFIGNYLRLEILKNNGYDVTVRENIKDYFYYMAEKTGTLWESAQTDVSCDHGFASCVIYWLM